MRERCGEGESKRAVYSLGHHDHSLKVQCYTTRGHTQRSSSLISAMTCIRHPLSAFQLKRGGNEWCEGHGTTLIDNP
jgi:hypothetical protein